MNILIVDDDEDTTTLLAMMLCKRGWKVDAAATVREARAALEHNDYAVLITDINLPDAPGTELIAYASRTEGRVTIVVSGAHDDAKRAREQLLGVHYLVKPVDGARLIQTIEGLIQDESLA